MVKIKTSVYVDGDVWARFKEHAVRMGRDVSSLLEDLMRDEVAVQVLEDSLLELTGGESCYEIDFEPIKPREGLVSELIRVMRDERSGIP